MTSTFLGYRLYATDYNKTLKQTAASPVTARDTSYYQANIDKVKTADEFVNNFRLFSYAMKAYGLSDMVNAKSFMKKVLESDLTVSNSFANTLSDSRYARFAAAFSFVTTKGKTLGTVTDSTAVQSSDQENETLGLYERNAASVSTSDEAYYKSTIGTVKTVDDLTKNSRLLSVVLTAYGIDAAHTSDATLKQELKAALESDASNPKSEANQSVATGFKALAADFNFAADGKVTNQRLIQTQADFAVMHTAYISASVTDTASKAAATAETTYVGNIIAKAQTIDAVVNDARVVAYIGKAFGVTGLTSKTLRQVLTSDPNDLTSAAATLGDQDRKIAEAFNVTTTGTIARVPVQAAQSRGNVAETTRSFLEAAVSENAKTNQGEGVRLALNFRQKAGTITNVFQILANADLLKVVQTGLGIPASSTSQSIDAQAKVITSRLKLADLRDPTKLNTFISRFAALYDIAAASSSDSSTASSASASVQALFPSASTPSYTTLSLFQ